MGSTPISPGQAGRVPVAGQAIVELLNSRPHAIHGDRLDDPEYAAAVVRRFAPEPTMISAQVLDEVRAIRADLNAIVAAQEPADAEKGWRDLTAHTSSVTLQQDFAVPGELRMRQVTGDPVIGGIARTVAELVSSGGWSRIRFCANEQCGGAFYDATRSRTQRWDSYETCGNRTNVAAYRARTRRPDGRSGA